MIASLVFVATLRSDKIFSLEHERNIAYYSLTKILKNYMTYLNTDRISTTTLNNDLVFYYKEIIPSLENIELYHWLYPYKSDEGITFYSTTTSIDTTPTHDIEKWDRIVVPLKVDIISFSATPFENKNLRYRAAISLENAISYIDTSSATLTIEGLSYPPLK